MKNCKLLAVCFALAIALLTASASYGQTVLIGVGSSALWPSVGLSAITGDPITGSGAICGSNFWTGGSSSASSIAVGVDSRTGFGIHNEPGTIWVAWDNDTAPTKVCAFLNVDSVVGSRLFLEQGAGSSGNGSLSISQAATYTLGINKVAFAQDNTSCAASTGATSFNVSLSLVSGTTLQATVFGGGNFSNYFANGAVVTVTGSAVSADNVSGVKISGVTQLSPLSFTYSGGAGAASDSSGSALVTVTPNCPGLPVAVLNALSASPHFTVGFTDIRPEDGVFAYHRANDLGGFPSDPTTGNMDYAGKGILSSYSNAVAYPVNFNLTGSDPLTGTAIPPVVVQSVGAEPVVVIVNNNDTTACGTGSTAFGNVTADALSRAYAGLAGATQDLDPSLNSSVSGCPKPLWPVEREPLSGTYNTFEWQVVRPDNNRGQAQENYNISYPQSNNNASACGAWVSALTSTAATSFPPSVAPPLHFDANNCGNPLNIQTANYTSLSTTAGPYGGYGGNRTRAIGTGEMVGVINSGAGTANSIGYAFYSLGTFGGKTGVKYVTLDGVDPLYSVYSSNPNGIAGTVAPSCTGFVNKGTFSCGAGVQPNFNGVVTGNYRVWEPLHAIYTGSAISTCAAPYTAVTIGCLIQAAQDQAANNVKDFVPVQTCGTSIGSCTVTNNFFFFRSHYQNAGPAPHDGNQPPPGSSCIGSVPLEAGGDMAGAIYPKQTDWTLQNNVGCTAELTNQFQ